MRVRVHLPDDVVSALSSYGDISKVASTILDSWEYGDVLDCEVPRENDHRHILNIHSSVYETQRELYGATSNRCSIRGILCKVAYYMLDWLEELICSADAASFVSLLQDAQQLLGLLCKNKKDEHVLKAKEEIDEAIKSYKT